MRAKSIELIMKFNSFRRVATHLAAACITTLTPFLLFSIFAFRRPFHMIRSVGINAIIDLFLFQQFFLNFFLVLKSLPSYSVITGHIMRTLLMRYYSPCLSHFQSKALDLLLADYTVAIFVICFVYSNRF